ncbi:hypothetical protein M0R45_008494 [Rubus argutus]|uniref:BED-type domain-containing protein n=1 Tax=Rubus argutus TaxID=59490 RepID=A0AAW1Y1E0_RUBAR
MLENSIPTPPTAPMSTPPTAPVPTTPTTESVNTIVSRSKSGKNSGLPGNHGPLEIWAVHITKHLIPEKYAGMGSCNYSGEHIVAPSSGGTTKLWNHLNKCRSYKDSNVDHSPGVLTTTGD